MNLNQNQEIELELTYLAKSLPKEIEGQIPDQITDTMFPETDVRHPKLRLRKRGQKYEITKKLPVTEGDASVHLETTIPLTEKEYESLSQASSRRVVKDRYKVTVNGYQAEVDVFQEKLKGLVLIDFEFKTPEEKDSFEAPSVCLAEVTQEEFIAGGMLAGKSYKDIETDLKRFRYKKL